MEERKEVEEKQAVEKAENRPLVKERELLCRIARMLYDKGLVSGTDGNISMKTGKDEMLITPSGVCKAFLKPELLLRQQFDGTVLEGDQKPTKEAALHSSLYEQKPGICAIVHTHPAAATAFAVCGMPLPDDCLVEVPSLLGNITVAGYAPAGSRELVREVEKASQGDVIFLQNHGVITYGKSLEEAFARMDAVENAAKTILYARLLGEVKTFKGPGDGKVEKKN